MCGSAYDVYSLSFHFQRAIKMKMLTTISTVEGLLRLAML